MRVTVQRAGLSRRGVSGHPLGVIVGGWVRFGHLVHLELEVKINFAGDRSHLESGFHYYFLQWS